MKVFLVHLGYKCDLRCTHCYVDASSERSEEMRREIMDAILGVLACHEEITHLDITGGAPELNPHYKYFVKSAVELGKKVMVRSNLTVFTTPGKEDTPDFLAENGVKIFASLPCFTEKGVDRQRGKGTYKKVIHQLKRLNSLGYGKDGPSLELDIVFNPPEASRAPDREKLEKDYREKLLDMHGITFDHFVAISNVPVGRLGKSLKEDQYRSYLKELEDNFNPDTVNALLCREQLCVSCDGTLYDCGFNQIQKVPVMSGRAHIHDFDYELLSKREIAGTPVCFACTAGSGLGCLRSDV